MQRTRRSAEEPLAHVGWVRRVAGALARDADEAEELEQETWSAALARRQLAPIDLRAWQAGVARSLAARVAGRERAVAREESMQPAHELVARAGDANS